MAGNSDFSIDPDAVKAQSPKLAELATELSSGLSTLKSGLDSIGNAWGDDEFGDRFAQNYTGKAEEALTAIDGAVQLLQFLGRGVEATGTTFQNLDQDFKDALTKVTEYLDGKG
ncbi:WXG100 family type VII secretion target [Nocardia bhagyanarayanae]|uniref:Type VII secretion system (Wss) protein ESAT-6 n=1 Tax=Nocardia bhagyanarayanae TaxID=1215925 RepID=A0A543FBF4_9NOCA|nr:WXG100 family type VII secretion target [Nocardia bhagyanarayanae]TQM31161.1 type VII secretion system (Wss) protein ESAT-6 [Nocardia bhagyanarayanae]